MSALLGLSISGGLSFGARTCTHAMLGAAPNACVLGTATDYKAIRALGYKRRQRPRRIGAQQQRQRCTVRS